MFVRHYSAEMKILRTAKRTWEIWKPWSGDPLQKKNLTAKGSDDKRALLVSYADLITM